MFEVEKCLKITEAKWRPNGGQMEALARVRKQTVTVNTA